MESVIDLAGIVAVNLSLSVTVNSNFSLNGEMANTLSLSGTVTPNIDLDGIAVNETRFNISINKE